MPSDADAKMIFRSAHYIQYEQVQLNNNYKLYLETTLISERALRTGIKNTLSNTIRDKHRHTIVRC